MAVLPPRARSPTALLALLIVVLLAALVFASTTTTAAFGAYNPAWDGASDLQTQADAVETESTIALNTTVYADGPSGETVAVILTPDEDYGPRDMRRIQTFLADGGTLLVAEDFGPHSNALLSGLGVTTRFDGRLLRDERHYYRSPNITVATDVTPHPMTAGVGSLTLNHGTALTNVSDADGTQILVNSSSYSYLDGNRNSRLDDTESLERRPVAVVEEVGQGQVVIVSDPSMLINAMIERSGNRAFVRTLFASHNRVVLDYSHAESLPPLSYAFVVVRGSGGLQTVVVLGVIGAGSLLLRRPKRLTRLVLPSTERWSLDEDALVAQLRSEHPEWDDERVERVARSRRWEE